MKQIRHSILLLIMFSFTGLFASVGFAGNGSSGVGLVPVGGTINARINDYKTVIKQGDHLVDLTTGENILKVEKIDSSELKKYQKHLAHSDLGSVKGYEYLPEKDVISHEDNFWVICPKDQGCLKLTPESDSNSRVMDVIGGLELQKK
jgi:hypothetical protein